MQEVRDYKSKEELLTEIQKRYQAYIHEFNEVPEELKNKRLAEVDKTPAENLAYQLGWISLLLDWEKKEKAGVEVQTPTEGYKWNNLGGLYQSFYQRYASLTLKEQVQLLDKKVNALASWIETLSDEELFEPEQRRWATTKAKWPLYKWIHINTVAPFTNFRTKIRKWKKVSL